MSLGSRLNLGHQSNATLLRLIAQHNLAAYKLLYYRHAHVIFNLLVRIVGDSATAEDLLQKVFGQIWKDASQYQGSSEAMVWMMRIARNHGLDQLQRQRVGIPTVGAEATEMEAIVAPVMTEEAVENQMRRGHVQHALAAIPEEQRICLELAYFEGLNQHEIAKKTNVAVETVKSRIRIGLETVEMRLRSSGHL